ncbi:restriction endonuclease subunit S [Enterobacter hormaechei]|uniref:restriction endonuclease subunit S n=1 Tax=Enterobacter hormaechei TaxID=158836 RepID=UPI003CF9FBE8
MVPEGWKHGFVKDLANTVMGYAFKSTDFVPDGIPLLRMGNLYQNMLDLERNPVFLPKRYLSDFSRFIVRPGDLVMSMTGTMGKRDYGFTVQIPDNVPELLLNQRVMKFEPKKDACLEYLLNLFRSEMFLNYLYSFPGGTKQANLSAKQVQELPVLIPPKAEQKKIAKILSTWDKAITTTEQLLTNSQQQKKALMQQLITGNRRFPEFKGRWEKRALSEICILGAGQPAPQEAKYFIDGNHDFLRVSDLGSSTCRWAPQSRDKVNQLAIRECSLGVVPAKATLFTKSGASLLLNQRAQLKENSFIVSHLGFAKAKDGVSDDFVFYLMCSIDFNRYAAGTSLPALQLSVLKSLKVLVPPYEEQIKIASMFSDADMEISILEKKLFLLKQEKKALMQQLLTGKRRVKVEAA